MTTSLRILLVEDSQDDALLLLRILKEGGYETVHAVVDTSDTFKAALAKDTWDIVVSDYTMPRFNGLVALKLFKETGLDIPFILVSGSIGEDLAVAAMKAGAHDYLLKDNLQRLVPAIEREIQEARERAARRQAEEELRMSEMRFRGIYESDIIGVVYCDIYGNLKMANRSFLNMLGYAAEEIECGQVSWSQITPPEWQYHDQLILKDLLFGDGVVRPYEKQLVHKDGQPVDILIGMSLLGNTREEVLACVLDLSERRAKEEMEQLNVRKNRFLTMVSHELRTPLHNIIIGANMGAEGFLGQTSDKQQQYFSMIHESGEHLLRIINDILDISKIEAGKEILCPTTINLDKFVTELLPLVQPLLEKKNQQLMVFKDETLPATFHADSVRIKQVLVNLLSNAHKFSSEHTKIHFECRNDSPETLMFIVKDEGPGIDPADLEIILKPFEQGTPKPSSIQGTGLGLPLTIKLIELHRGTFEIKSEPGQGCECIVGLPLNGLPA